MQCQYLSTKNKQNMNASMSIMRTAIHSIVQILETTEKILSILIKI